MSTLRAVELIKTAAENITGFTFITGTRLLNNIEADDQRLPLIMLVRPLSIPVTIASGGRLRDSYQCLVIFASKSELEYQFDLHEPIVGDMRLAADQFFVNLNSFSDYVQAISSITYADYINDFDANLTGVAATFTLELIPLDEQVCPTGTFVPEYLPPFSRYLTEVAVDGVTITGNGTTEDPLVAIGGGGGGGSLRVQDEGTTVTNAATTLNFTGNVTASLSSAGNVTVNVPDETPQVNADWNASSGVAEILNKPSIPAAQIQSDWNQANNAALDFIKNKPTIPSTSGLVPYTGATTNVDLGTHTLSAKDLVISHPSGSGVAASITKGGNGEALTVVKSSGSGNAASITGGVTLIDELHLTTDLADAYIASAATWNAKFNTPSGTIDQYVRGDGSLATFPALPLVFKNIVDGAASSALLNTFSSSILVPANSVVAGNVIEFKLRGRKTGINATYTIRLYANTVNSLLGSPILLATFTGGLTQAIGIQLTRTAAVKNVATNTEMLAATTANAGNDNINSLFSSISVDWTTDKYIIGAVQSNNAADSTLISLISMTII